MTARARRMLAALEDGCETRDQIFSHQGRFSLLNNGAAELRAAGFDVECVLVDGEYRYRLLDEGRSSPGPAAGPPEAPLIEGDDGWLALDLETAAA